MKKTIYLIITAVLSLAVTSSCKKYLDKKSDLRLVIPKTLGDAQGLMDDANLMNLRTSPSYGEASSDDYFLPPSGFLAVGTIGQDVYTWKPLNYRYVNDWSLGYLAIYNSNLCLELMENIERNAFNGSDWDNVKGSAHFYRAYYFLMLTGQYGLAYDEASSSKDLGVPLRLNSDFNIPSQRATVKECYQQVIKDATEALGLLPNYPQHSMRPSKGAAYALLARCYLSMHKYDLALNYVTSALALNNKLMDYNGDTDVAALSGNTPFKKFNKETVWYAELAGGFGVHSILRARIDTTLYNAYDVNDLRKIAYFREATPYQQFKGNYTANINAFFSGIATDELYLISAECKAYLNDIDGGLIDLNTLLKTRWRKSALFQPITALNRSDALVKIRLERRKELVMRGLRFYDLKRYNKEGLGLSLVRVNEGITVTLPPNSPFYALPLPTDIIELTGMPQN